MWTIIRIKNEHRNLDIDEAMMTDNVAVEMHDDITFDTNIILTHDQYIQKFYKEVLSRSLLMDTFNLECTMVKWKKIYEIKNIADLVHIMRDGILGYHDLVETMDKRERSQLASILAFAEVLEDVKSEEIVIALDDIGHFGNWNIGDLILTHDAKFSIDPSVILLPLWHRVKEAL